MAFDVFISYAHKDRKLRDELEAHLSNLRNQELSAIGLMAISSTGNRMEIADNGYSHRLSFS